MGGGGGGDESFGLALTNLLETSSAHGLPNIQRSRSIFSKGAWTLLFFASVSILIIQVHSLFSTYLAYGYTVSLDVRFERALDFPAVTVCNINPVRKTKLAQASDGFREIFDVNFVPPGVGDTGDHMYAEGAWGEGGQAGQGETTASGGAAPQPAGQPNTPAPSGEGMGVSGPGLPIATALGDPATGMPTDTVTVDQTTTVTEVLNSTSSGNNTTTEAAIPSWGERETSDFYKKRDDGYLLEQRLISHLANLTEDERKDMGHSLDDMLLDCQWKGYPCSPTNFTSFYHYKYGNCYTFNSFKFGDSLRTNRPGPLYGLTLELYLEQDEYMPEITEAAGFMLVIHDRDSMPFPEDDGIAISPGSKTSINVRVMTFERLRQPYGNCTEKDVELEEADSNIFKDRYGVQYSLKACERSCYQKEVIKQCGCFDPYYPNSIDDLVYPCGIDDETAQSCMTKLEDEYKEGTLTCSCYQRCNETTYHTAASSSLWPADQFQAKLFRDINKRNEDVRDNLRNVVPRDWVLKNVAKLEVFFQEFNYEYIKQSPAYTELDLASDIGGQLGLWLGLSILTVFELVEHAGTFLAIVFRKLCGGCGDRKNNDRRNTRVQKIRIFPTDDPGVSLPKY